MNYYFSQTPIEQLAPKYEETISDFQEYITIIVFGFVFVGLVISFIKSLRG